MRLGRYETLQPIASGGMAVVHLARALGAGGFERLVAIKVMHPHIASEPEFVAMFLDEARLAAQIRHPNVVGTIDVQEEPLFLVMEYIEGPSLHVALRELRRRNEKLDVGVVLRVLHDALLGLHAAHEQKGSDGAPLEIIHRDVTPHNILLGVDGVSRITDFGVARAASRLSSTRGGQVKGKLSYMAPEQFHGQDIDRRVDVYAAGAVLYEALSGQQLFKADTEAALMGQIIRGVMTPLRTVEPRVPQVISDVCMRALSREPSDRYATAADLADAIEDAARAAGTPIATARAVAAAVKALAVHEPPPAIPGPSGVRVVPPAPVSGSGQHAPLSGSGERAPVPAPPPDVDESPSQSTSVGTLLAPAVPLPQPSAKRSWKLMVGVTAVVGVGLGVAAFVSTRSTGTEVAGQTRSPTTSTTPVPSIAAKPPAPETSAPATEPPPSSSSSVAPPSASASAKKTAPSALPGGNRPPPPSRTAFRPDDL
jgi:serine/threonine-protein kinase